VALRAASNDRCCRHTCVTHARGEIVMRPRVPGMGVNGRPLRSAILLPLQGADRHVNLLPGCVDVIATGILHYLPGARADAVRMYFKRAVLVLM